MWASSVAMVMVTFIFLPGGSGKVDEWVMAILTPLAITSTLLFLISRGMWSWSPSSHFYKEGGEVAMPLALLFLDKCREKERERDTERKRERERNTKFGTSSQPNPKINDNLLLLYLSPRGEVGRWMSG